MYGLGNRETCCLIFNFFAFFIVVLSSKEKEKIGVIIMCLEVHLGFGVLAVNFVSLNNYFGYKQTRHASLDILTTSYHDGIWLCLCSNNHEPSC